MEDDLNKNGRQPQKKDAMEDDLKKKEDNLKKIEEDLKKMKWKTT
jgi:hypothetical protein